MASLRKRLHYRFNDYRRNLRYWFPSPAEMKFVQIMGGWVITIKWIKFGKNKFPLAIVVWKGWRLRREYMKREVRIGPYYCDFYFESAYTRRAIEIDGFNFHKLRKIDIVYDQQRDDYLWKRGVVVMRINARDLWRDPKDVRRRVKIFLSK